MLDRKNKMHNANGSGRDSAQITKEFVDVAGISTPIVKLGKLNKKSNQNGNSRILMLIITGNPGNPCFYEDFMQEIYKHSQGAIPVWTIGQAGHVKPPDQSLCLKDVYSTDEKKFGLQGQIKHKLHFIEENIPDDVKLVLIGHSIGCYMILNMLDSLPQDKVLRCFMLMPTIERMAESPNGLKMTPVFRNLRWVIVLCALFLIFIPKSIRSRIVSWLYPDSIYPDCARQSILATVTPWTANYSTFLAKLEMNQVTDLQKHLIQTHSEKLSLYYGSNDHWCPVQYYYDFKTEFPEVDAKICELNLKHAFVMESKEGQVMADVLWQWFRNHHFDVLTLTDSVMENKNHIDDL